MNLESTLDSIQSSLPYGVGATLLTLLVAVVLVWLTNRAIARWRRRIERTYQESHDHDEREQGQRIETVTGVVRLTIDLTIWAIAILTILSIWGIPLGPLVAVAAAFGVALGFGAQDLVKDVLGGLFILIEDQYSVGDIVAIGGVAGEVEEVTLRTTVLRDLEGIRHHVPNGEVRVSSNYTQGFSRALVDVSVAYGADLDVVLAVVEDEARRFVDDEEWVGKFIDEPKILGVNELGDSSIQVRVVLTTITEERWSTEREFLKRIKRRFDAEGIEIPYPYFNIVERSDQSD